MLAFSYISTTGSKSVNLKMHGILPLNPMRKCSAPTVWGQSDFVCPHGENFVAPPLPANTSGWRRIPVNGDEYQRIPADTNG